MCYGSQQCASCDNILKQMDSRLNSIYESMANVNILAQAASKFIKSLNQIVQTMILVLIVYQVYKPMIV